MIDDDLIHHFFILFFYLLRKAYKVKDTIFNLSLTSKKYFDIYKNSNLC